VPVIIVPATPVPPATPPAPAAPPVGEPDEDDEGEEEPGAGPGVGPTAGDDVTVVTGASIVLEGVAPDCALRVTVDGETVGGVVDDSGSDTFVFRVPTDGLEVGEHTAELTCSDGTPVFERPFTLVRPVSNNSGGTGLIAFLMFLVLLLGGRFALGGGLADDRT
jgi:hypothetical protein